MFFLVNIRQKSDEKNKRDIEDIEKLNELEKAVNLKQKNYICRVFL